MGRGREVETTSAKRLLVWSGRGILEIPHRTTSSAYARKGLRTRQACKALDGRKGIIKKQEGNLRRPQKRIRKRLQKEEKMSADQCVRKKCDLGCRRKQGGKERED